MQGEPGNPDSTKLAFIPRIIITHSGLDNVDIILSQTYGVIYFGSPGSLSLSFFFFSL